MLKEVLAVGGGIVVGVAICYVGYRVYKNHSEKNAQKEKDFFAEKLKEKEAQAKRFSDLLSSQIYVENLTAKDLTAWFKENRNTVPEDAKMIIITPTEANLKGLGYSADSDLDIDTNVIQVFYNDVTSEVYKNRLVNFTNIESNLQAQLIEQDGMMVVTA
jgi:transposase